MNTGNCYQVCFEWLMDHPNKDKFQLAHGIVTGQGPIEGIKYGHAWIIEPQSDVVIDVAAEVVMPLRDYIKFGQIEYYVQYTWAEAVKKCNEFGHYGSWDEKVSAAVHKGDNDELISGSSPISR